MFTYVYLFALNFFKFSFDGQGAIRLVLLYVGSLGISHMILQHSKTPMVWKVNENKEYTLPKAVLECWFQTLEVLLNTEMCI